MPRGTQGPLARLFEQGAVAGMTDGQLLDRFTTRRGDAAEAAFEALVARHGPMVARVCRSCLRDEHDVEDAFQATFLVLVRRAGAIGERDLLAPWLYGVAHRVARKARAVAAKRRGREGGLAPVDPPARVDGSTAFQVDLGPVLHEEVDRLPAKYRQPVILCHLQGLTHAQAAQELAWPVGTVSVRLARARKLLADRLARRGVTASATVVATALAGEASAALAPSWIQTAAVAALTAASGLPLTTATAAISAGAVTLARRTSMTLLLSSWKWLAIPAAVALTTATGAALVGSAGSKETLNNPPADQRSTSLPNQVADVTDNSKSKSELTRGEVPTSADARAGATAADLAIDLMGERFRQSGQATEYKVIVTNTGAAPTQAVVISATLPQQGGKLRGGTPPKGATFSSKDRKLLWRVGQLDPGQSFESIFHYDNTTPGTYQCSAEATAGDLRVSKRIVTEVSSITDLDLKVSQTDRVIDVGKTTSYTFEIKNVGTKAATKIQLSGTLDDLRIRKPTYEGSTGEFWVESKMAGQQLQFRFPTIPQLEAGQSVALGLEVEALRKGKAGALVELTFGELGADSSDTVRGAITTTVIDPNQAQRGSGGRSPLPSVVASEAEKPTIVVLENGELGPLPPGYFDLPAPKPGTPGAPQPVRIGQTLQVEALEALPGRPISGERIVRSDGTISLEFYGNLYVVGLNRDQIKVKVIEQLRKYLSDNVLGLIGHRDDGTRIVAIPPVESNRVFVDDQPKPTPPIAPAPQPNSKPAASAAPRPVSGPIPVKVGQTLVIEVLEALPGRPIGGERVVRPDGTVGLGFYGDVAVAGLTRDQIKVKVIDHLRKYLSDEALGLRLINNDTDSVKTWTVLPLQSDRVFVADDVDFDWSTATPPPPDGKVQVGQILAIEVLHALPGRPISGQRIVQPDGTVNLGFYGNLSVVGLTRDQIKVAVIDLLRTKVSAEQLGLVKEGAQGEKQPVAPVDSASVFVDDAVPRPMSKTADQVRKLSEQVTDLSGKLDAALGAIEQLRRDRPRDAFGPPRR